MPILDWIGKSAVQKYYETIPYHLLQENAELSVGQSDNILVQGDNLLALKALLPYYAGQVKCVYIDPPYNTGNQKWVYNDNVDSEEIREWLGKVVGKELEDLSRHDKWLCMMYPRLKMLRKFLSEDGVILISIDDNEVASLRFLLDEIFLPNNFIACCIWEKSKKGDAKLISVSHEYIMIYAKNKSFLTAKNTIWRKKKPGIDDVLNKYADLRNQYGEDHDEISKQIKAWYRSLPKKSPPLAHKHYNKSDKKGLYFAADFSGPDDGRDSRPRYDIIHPVTGKPCKKPSTGWRWEEAKTIRALEMDPPRIHFGKDHTTIPCRKSYLFEIDEEPFSSVFYKDGRSATLDLEQILGPGIFEFPKDSHVLSELLMMITGPNDIILDSFAGSGTTGETVLKMNKEDKRNRKFILVELEDHICKNVTRARLEKVINGYIPEKKTKNTDRVEGTGGGFKYFQLGNSLFKEFGQLRENIQYNDLACHIYYSETGKSLARRDLINRPYIGKDDSGTSYYLLLDPENENIEVSHLNLESLQRLSASDGQKVIYAESCRVSPDRLKKENIIFKQIPYGISQK